MNHVPDNMQCLEMTDPASPNGGLRLTTKPVPRPGPSEVLVRIAASPINPSDLSFLEGRYGIRKALPVVPGFEASGTIVATGLAPLERALVGRQIFTAAGAGDGTWSQYMIAKLTGVLPLPKPFTLEEGSMLFVNPLTAIAFVEMARRAGAKAIVHTASGSSVGRMLEILARDEGLDVIHVVRRSAQRDQLLQNGFRTVLASDAVDFQETLTATCRSRDARMGFDAVSGNMSGLVLSALGKGGKLYVYGALSAEAAQASPADLIFHGKSVHGFWLSHWMKGLNLASTMRRLPAAARKLHPLMEGNVRAKFPLTAFAEALELARNDTSTGKIIFTP